MYKPFYCISGYIKNLPAIENESRHRVLGGLINTRAGHKNVAQEIVGVYTDQSGERSQEASYRVYAQDIDPSAIEALRVQFKQESILFVDHYGEAWLDYGTHRVKLGQWCEVDMTHTMQFDHSIINGRFYGVV